ncbi:MAG: hypothetical protein ABIJ96_14030 [Elusimicrobiota bacterium]
MHMHWRRTALWAVGPVLLARLVFAAPLSSGATSALTLPGLEDAVATATGTYETKRYSLRIAEGWWGPITLPHGESFARPNTSASFTVIYRRRHVGKWGGPAAYRAHLRSKGTIADTHVLSPVKVAGRYGSRARYRTVVYGQKKLFGDRSSTYTNEEIVIPDPDGLYVLHYKALAEEFDRHRDSYLTFLRTMTLRADERYRPEEFYLDRDGMIEDVYAGRDAALPTRLSERPSYVGTRFAVAFSPGYSRFTGKLGGVDAKEKTGAGANLRFLFYPWDWLGFGPELGYTQYFKEKRTVDAPPATGIDTTINTLAFSLVTRINPIGKQKWTPYFIAGFGQHDTAIKLQLKGEAPFACFNNKGLAQCDTVTLKSKGTVLTAALGLEARFSDVVGMSLEARAQRLGLSGGAADVLTGHLGMHWRFGVYRFYEDINASRRAHLQRRDKEEKKGQEDVPVPLPGFDDKEAPAPKNRRYSHQVPLGWRGPVAIPGGERYAAPGGQASFSITYQTEGSDDWLAPDEFRRRLRAKGAISDRRTLDTVMLGDRFASRARYTTHLYRDHWHIGERHEAFYTEEIYAPETAGHFLIRYRAPKDIFLTHYRGYQDFLQSLELAKDEYYAPEKYYRLRDHVLKDLIEEDLRIDNAQSIKRRILFAKRLQTGFALTKPTGFTFNLFYALSDNWSGGIYYGLAKMSGHKGVGIRARWHLRDVVSTGPYLFGDVGAVTPKDAKTQLFNSVAGLGWLHLWNHFYADAGYGYGPKRDTFQGLLYLSGGMRF